MAIDTSGTWWRGTEAGDLETYLVALTEDDRAVGLTVHARCGSCGGSEFSLRVDPDEGCAERTCATCGNVTLMLDSEDSLEDADLEDPLLMQVRTFNWARRVRSSSEWRCQLGLRRDPMRCRWHSRRLRGLADRLLAERASPRRGVAQTSGLMALPFCRLGSVAWPAGQHSSFALRSPAASPLVVRRRTARSPGDVGGGGHLTTIPALSSTLPTVPAPRGPGTEARCCSWERTGPRTSRSRSSTQPDGRWPADDPGRARGARSPAVAEQMSMTGRPRPVLRSRGKVGTGTDRGPVSLPPAMRCSGSTRSVPATASGTRRRGRARSAAAALSPSSSGRPGPSPAGLRRAEGEAVKLTAPPTSR